MEAQALKGALQALLFAGGEPLSADRIAEVLGLSRKEAVALAQDEMASFNAANAGVQIVRLEDCYQMCSAPAFAPQVRALLEIRRNAPLSQAALEVLAIIAYNQPVTKAFVEQIRGVDSSGVVGSLCQKELVEERGRLELPGHPLLYGTTSNFLRCMGISSLEDLPPLRHNTETEGHPTQQLETEEPVPMEAVQ